MIYDCDRELVAEECGLRVYDFEVVGKYVDASVVAVGLVLRGFDCKGRPEGG